MTIPKTVTLTLPDGPAEGIRYIREDLVGAKRPTFFCPLFPGCGCPEGGVRSDCPALEGEETA